MKALQWLCYWLFTIPALPWLLGVRYFTIYGRDHIDGSLADELRYMFVEYPTYLFDQE